MRSASERRAKKAKTTKPPPAVESVHRGPLADSGELAHLDLEVQVGAGGVQRIRLLESDKAAHRQGDKRAHAAFVVAKRMAHGQEADSGSVELDLSASPPFHQRTFLAAQGIRRGETLTYGELAERLENKGASRAVGQAMAKNPFVLVVPCHRVLPSSGSLGGFSAPGGAATKQVLLRHEGVDLSPSWSIEEAVQHLRAADPKLARYMDVVGPCLLRHRTLHSLFDALAESVVYQQLSGKAAATIMARVIALTPPKRFNAEEVAKVSDEALRGAGLSRAKLAAIRDLQARELNGTLPSVAQVRRWSDGMVVERLSEVRGIGRWTAEMLLLFRLRRPDVFPRLDLGVQKGLQRVLGKHSLTARDLEQAAQRYAPFGSVAAWYLWRVTELKDEPA